MPQKTISVTNEDPALIDRTHTGVIEDGYADAIGDGALKLYYQGKSFGVIFDFIAGPVKENHGYLFHKIMVRLFEIAFERRLIK